MIAWLFRLFTTSSDKMLVKGAEAFALKLADHLAEQQDIDPALVRESTQALVYVAQWAVAAYRDEDTPEMYDRLIKEFVDSLRELQRARGKQ